MLVKLAACAIDTCNKSCCSSSEQQVRLVREDEMCLVDRQLMRLTRAAAKAGCSKSGWTKQKRCACQKKKESQKRLACLNASVALCYAAYASNKRCCSSLWQQTRLDNNMPCACFRDQGCVEQELLLQLLAASRFCEKQKHVLL